jgi:predicted metal-dependent peptidase
MPSASTPPLDAPPVTELAARLDRAFVHLRQHFPFWVALLRRCEIRSAPDTVAATAFVTEGGMIVIGQSFLRDLSDTQLCFVLAHEVAHLAFNHFARRGERDPMLWNMATDYTINFMIVRDMARHDAKRRFMVEGMLLDDRFDDDWSAEAIYDCLEREGACQPGGGSADGAARPCSEDMRPNGTCDSDADLEGSMVLRSPTDPIPSLPEEWDEAVKYAESVEGLQRKWSQCSGGATRPVTAKAPARTDWRSLLRHAARRCLGGVKRTRFTLLPPNRRHVHRGAYLPRMRSLRSKSPVLAVVVDTSGSIDALTLMLMAGQIEAIRRQTECRLYLIECDCAVRRATWIGPKEPMPTDLCGGGGTDFRPPFDHLSEERIRPDVLIYLTDGLGSFGAVPPYSVIWLMTTTVTPPFGSTVRLSP